MTSAQLTDVLAVIWLICTVVAIVCFGAAAILRNNRRRP